MLKRGEYVRVLFHGQPTSRTGQVDAIHADGTLVVDMIDEYGAGGLPRRELFAPIRLQQISKEEAMT